LIGRAQSLLVLALCTSLVAASGCRTEPQTPDGDAAHPQFARQPQDPRVGADDPPDPKAAATPARTDTTTPRYVRDLPIPQQTRDPQLPPGRSAERWLGEREIVSPAELSLGSADRQAQDTQPPAVERLTQTPAQTHPAVPALRPGMADEMVRVNFENMEIRTVLKTIGEITGINFIPHQSVTGSVTVMSPTPIRLGDLYTFLQSILDVYGYATIETENAVKVVPKADAARNRLQVRSGADPAAIPKTDAVVTQIVQLKYANADEVRQIIEPVVSTGAQISTYPRTNSLMITDTSANIHHVAEIIQQLDVEGSQEKVLMLPLTHASARVVSEQITRILEKNKGAGPQTGRVAVPTAFGTGSRVLPDDRTNSLVVMANEQDAQLITDLVEQLDIQRPVGVNNFHVIYLKNADANDVGRSLEQALASMRLTGAAEAPQQVQVTPDASTNALVIAAVPQDFEVISQIVEKLDIVREQVLVEMLILEVTEESLQEIGVDWATLDAAVSDSIRGFGMTNLGPRVNFLSGTAEGLSVGAWRANDSGVQIGAILQALQRESGVHILSTPSIVTSNHRQAKIIVGENRPFVTESRITESTDPITPTVIKSFEYKDVGITLEITPHVSQGGLIRLEIDSEFTKLIDDITNLSLDTPTTAKRTAQTVVTMGSGATIVIGGLIRDDTTHTVDKVPLLGDLPLVGALFRSERDRTQKTNLLLFITPHVMSTQDDLLKMTERKKEEMAPALEEKD